MTSELGPDTAPGSDDPRGSELAARLERTFQLLGRRIYLPSLRHLRAANPGLDKASVPLLGALEEHDGVRPSDLAVALELDLSTVSRQVHQLEQLGLVTRRPDGDDGRASRISLTPDGRESLAFVRASRAAMLDEVFRDWPEVERQDLLALLDRLLAGLTTLPGAVPSSAAPKNTAPSTSTSTSTSTSANSRRTA